MLQVPSPIGAAEAELFKARPESLQQNASAKLAAVAVPHASS